MKPTTPAIVLTVFLSMLSFSTVAAPQTNTKKAPLLTTEDLKESGSSSSSTSPASKSITRDSGKWQRYSPKELALSIELPGKPLLLGVSLPDAAGQQLSPAKAYTYQSEEISVFVFRFSIKKPPVSSSDLRNFGAGFLDASAKKPGVSDVENLTKLRDDSTVLLHGTYRVGSVVFATRGFVHTNGNDVWLIATRFLQADEPANELSLRIINSVKIE
ncbi:MAG: hypothetical protein AABN33_00615 [Acidobacteriota bacterium]